MVVYVDQWRNYNKRIGRAGPFWCHLVADTETELHEFATKVGLKRKWFQGASRFKHYDIGSEGVLKTALALGAKQVDGKELVAVMKGQQ